MSGDRATVLFLCSGNYYRSRFAEGLFNAHAETKALAWRADSAGLLPECFAENSGPISSITSDALRARGILLARPERAPRAATLEDLQNARRIVAMDESEHRPVLRARFADFESRVEYWTVHDI